jgi:predicted protein tyrosine phosphatase
MTATYNQLANINNPYQGKSKKVLCLCSAGLLRSPTAANVLHREFGFNTRSAGVMDYALIPFSEALFLWADEILVMDLQHYLMLRVFITENSSETITEELMKKVLVLNIPDKFEFMNVELQELILTNYKKLKEESDERTD